MSLAAERDENNVSREAMFPGDESPLKTTLPLSVETTNATTA